MQITPKSAAVEHVTTDISESATTVLPAASRTSTTSALNYNGSESTIGSAELTVTDSHSSGYTTETSYRTATAGSIYSLGNSTYQRIRRHNVENYIREIHVGVEANATEAQIQAIRDDLRDLLSNEVDLIHETSGGSRRAVYLIAYQYM